MQKNEISDLLMYSNNIINELYVLESIVILAKEYCLKNDTLLNTSTDSLSLSKERNHYINLLCIAEEKIEKLKESFNKIENIAGCL